jgi:4-amino-4-deoxy-L-arabinose transferase-like glycosyltransferase
MTAAAPRAECQGGGRALLAAGLVLATLVPALALVLTTPQPGWDGVAIWHFKGRMFYLDGGVRLAALMDPVRGYAHPDYPLHVPLLLAGLAHAMGGWRDSLLLVVGPLTYAALLLLVYGTACLVARPALALAVVAGMAPLPGLVEYLASGYADLPLTMYAAGTLAGLVRWLTRGDRGALLLAGAAAGLGAWTKQEGWLLLGSHAVAAWAWAPRTGQRRAELLAPLGAALLVALPWPIVRVLAAVPAEAYALRTAELPARVLTIVRAGVREGGALERWGLLWAGAALGALPWGRAGARDPLAGCVATVLGLMTAAFVVVYSATPHDLHWHLATSLPRLLLHLLPAAATLVAVRLEALVPLPRRRLG